MALQPPVTITQADAYFVTTPRDAEWTAVTDKQIWLNEALRLLNGICYDTSNACCGRDFTAAWIQVNSELALALSKNPNAIIGGGTATSGLVKRNKLGDLEQEFFEPKDGQSVGGKYGPSDPLVLQKFPGILEPLECWMTLTKSSGTRVIARVRS